MLTHQQLEDRLLQLERAVKNFRGGVSVSPFAPANPYIGQQWINPKTGKMSYWNGFQWNGEKLYCRAYKNASTALGIQQFNVYDTNEPYMSSSATQILIPKDSDYLLIGSANFKNGIQPVLKIQVNGVSVATAFFVNYYMSGGDNQSFSTSITKSLKRGDYIELYASQSGGTIGVGGDATYLHVYEL